MLITKKFILFHTVNLNSQVANEAGIHFFINFLTIIELYRYSLQYDKMLICCNISLSKKFSNTLNLQCSGLSFKMILSLCYKMDSYRGIQEDMRIYASVFHRSLMLSNYCVKSHLEQFTHCEALILTNVHVVFELKLSILEWLYCVPWSEKNYAFLAYTKYTSIERIFFWPL